MNIKIKQKDKRDNKGYTQTEETEQIYAQKQQKEEKIRKLQDLIGKEKGFIKAKQRIRPFKGNVLFYIKKDRRIEIYDGIKEGTFKVENSEKKEVKYEFNTRDLCRMEWAGETVPCYIQYEEELGCYPREPWILMSVIETTVDKILTDMSKWKLEEEKLKLGKLWAWIGFAALIIGGFILYKMLVKPDVTAGTIQTAQNLSNVTQVMIQNATG